MSLTRVLYTRAYILRGKRTIAIGKMDFRDFREKRGSSVIFARAAVHAGDKVQVTRLSKRRRVIFNLRRLRKRFSKLEMLIINVCCVYG